MTKIKGEIKNNKQIDEVDRGGEVIDAKATNEGLGQPKMIAKLKGQAEDEEKKYGPFNH